MTAVSTRSLRAIVAGLAALAVVAVGCAAEPSVDDTETPSDAPDIDDTDQPDDSEDDTASSAPTSSSAPADSTTRPSDKDTEPASTKPTAKPPAKPATTPAAKPVTKPVVKAPKPVATPVDIADGGHAGRLVSITTKDVTVKLVRVLTGAEAIAAAKADGGSALDENGSLPNDVYIQDLKRVVTIPVAGDAGLRIYDCSGGCKLVGTTLTALAGGQAVPFGGPNAVINLTVEQGAVVSFEEQYLP